MLATTNTCTEVVNDVHSALTPTHVRRVVAPATVDQLCALVRDAAARGESLSIAGGRHAMGAQPFASGRTLLDMTRLTAPLRLDRDRGLLTIEAGADWPAIIRATHALQPGSSPRWGIRQKQTGADALTLGGAISANAHGRGLLMGPIVDDIEDLTLVTPAGDPLVCSRDANADLFRHAVGGYGLLGPIVRATLRLAPRRKLRRLVDIIDIDEAMHAVRRRIDAGCLYGDFQYAIDPSDDGFLRRGVMACYAPVDGDAPVDPSAEDLPRDRWLELLHLAHTDKRRAFALYAEHYLRSHGRVYWSDLMQLSTYIPTYAEFLASRPGGARDPGVRQTLVIGELAVAPERLTDLLAAARRVLHHQGVEDIYGTIRSLRQDTTTALPFARQDSACVIFNLRTPHTPDGTARTRDTFRQLYDAALALGGSFYLTYSRAATLAQVRHAYSGWDAFVAFKHAYDPAGTFTSDWFEHYRAEAGGPLA
jgi:FAD/FMN-containing dehydrogenase